MHNPDLHCVLTAIVLQLDALSAVLNHKMIVFFLFSLKQMVSAASSQELLTA